MNTYSYLYFVFLYALNKSFINIYSKTDLTVFFFICVNVFLGVFLYMGLFIIMNFTFLVYKANAFSMIKPAAQNIYESVRPLIYHVISVIKTRENISSLW